MTESESSESIPWGLPRLQIVLASTLLAPLGVPLIGPALPLLRSTFEVSETLASLIISSYFITGIVLSPFIGILSDRVGRKPVLVFSLFVFGIMGGSVFLVNNFYLILLIRFIQGTSAAGIFIATVAIISDTFDDVQRNSVLGINTAVLMFGAAIFPVVGGYLTNWSWKTPFLTYLAAVPLGIYAYMRMDESVSDENSQIDLSEALDALWDREILKLMGAALVNEVVLFGTVLTILPFILESNYGLNATQIGFVFMASTLSTVVSSSQNGFFAKRLTDNRIIAIGVLLYGIGSLVSWIAASVIMLGIAASILGIGVGLCMPSIDSAISGSIEDEKRASILSVRNSTTFLGRTTGPILYTFAASIFGYKPVLLFAGILVLIAGLFAFLKS